MLIQTIKNRKALAGLCLITLFFITGCNTYRLLPSHGGGKRFDEEQRAISSCIRNTVAQMDLKSLAAQKVNLAIVSLAQNGGASLTMPGINNISASYNNSSSDYVGPYMIDSQEGFNASVNFNPTMSAWPTVFPTDQDQIYMESSLQMKLRLQQSLVPVPDPAFMLYVLVDVLGTNRSKTDSFIYSKEVLLATCELTYYIVDLKTGKTLDKAKRVGAQSGYSEAGWFGFLGSDVERTTTDLEPTAMPTDVNDLPVISLNPIMATGLKPKTVQNDHHQPQQEVAANEPNAPTETPAAPIEPQPAAAPQPNPEAGIVPIPAAAPVAAPLPGTTDPNAAVAAEPTPVDAAAKKSD